MSEPVHAPVTQPNLIRKFPLVDMPAGLMAAGSRDLLITS
jgi:hypothetical protein